MTYRNRVGSDAGATSAMKIEMAARGKPHGVDDKIDEIAAYIKDCYDNSRLKDLDKIECPSPEKWSALAAGRRRTLPSATLLSLYANDGLRAAAKKLRGGIRQAYFQAARERVRRQLEEG